MAINQNEYSGDGELDMLLGSGDNFFRLNLLSLRNGLIKTFITRQS